MNVSQIMRVAAFCFARKSDEVLESTDAWVLYTGDGWILLEHLLAQWKRIYEDWPDDRPVIFVTGPDNGMLRVNKSLNAFDFASWLITQGLPVSRIIPYANPAKPSTHGQAESLIEASRQHGWRRVALFTSWYHAPRAWLTTIKRIPAGMNLMVIPMPSYGLSFSSPNIELEGSPSAWTLLNSNMLSRLESYQAQGFCATFEEADEYLKAHGL